MEYYISDFLLLEMRSINVPASANIVILISLYSYIVFNVWLFLLYV